MPNSDDGTSQKVVPVSSLSNDGSVMSDSVSNAFSGVDADRWSKACRKLQGAGYGEAVHMSYIRGSIAIAGQVDPELAIHLADVVSTVAIKCGRSAAQMLPVAAIVAARRLDGDKSRFRLWLELMERFASLAPESLGSVLDRTDVLLSRLAVDRLEAWMMAGVRSAGADQNQRLAFFSLEDSESARWLDHESGSVVLSEIKPELSAFMGALWNIHIPLREPPPSAQDHGRRRASFGQGLIRIPSSFPGFMHEQGHGIFRAAIAHIGAHIRYSGNPIPVAKLKPVQVALVSLIEDARVEQLAIREFPGLRELWMPFHVAQASTMITAPSLMARLSRALIDPDFKDENGWVTRAKRLFYERSNEWENRQISREIGGLIGNDLGQMRVQFNSKTYVIEPAYRDDNMGLWDFGEQQSPDVAEAEQLFDSINIEEQQDDDDSQPDRERDEREEDTEDDVNKMNIELIEENGMPVARYPEYDYVTGRSRPDWATVVEHVPKQGSMHMIDDILVEHSYIVNRIKSLITTAKISRPQVMRRQAEGDYLDINASIESVISRRVGETPDPHVYARLERRHRDMSVHVLLDASESTKDKVVGSNNSVLDLERQATALLAHAMTGLGDPFAIAAFNSNCRDEVRYYRLKDFGLPYSTLSKCHLAGLEGGYSTRIGVAMRHASEDLKKQLTYRKLLLVITDGEPSDMDVTDRNYLVEDARHVVHDLAMHGIDVFCVGLDSGGDTYLTRIFGRRSVVQVDSLERLPEKLPALYFRLTT